VLKTLHTPEGVAPLDHILRDPHDSGSGPRPPTRRPRRPRVTRAPAGSARGAPASGSVATVVVVVQKKMGGPHSNPAEESNALLQARGLLRTTTRAQNGAPRTFRVRGHTHARTRFVGARLSWEFTPSVQLWFNVGRVVVLNAPRARETRRARAATAAMAPGARHCRTSCGSPPRRCCSAPLRSARPPPW